MKKIKAFLSNNSKIISILILISFLIYYFSFSINIFWDSGHYMSYVSIFEGIMPWNTWDIVRGPIFPLIIYLSNFFFGKTIQGLLIVTFISYITMLIFVKKILDLIFKDSQHKAIIYLIIFSFIILNPIIFGYYHSLLTEFVAMTLAIVGCYLAIKWLNINFSQNKKSYIIYTLLFLILSIISYHLKQPYVSTIIFPLIISTVISICTNFKWSNVIQKLSVVIICFLGLIISIKSWNAFLSYKGIDLNTDRNVVATLGNQLFAGLNNYELIKDYSTGDNTLLSEKEIKDFQTNNYYVANVYNLSREIIDQKLIEHNEEKNISTFDVMKFVLLELFNHPLSVLDSYFSNYLAIADVYPKTTEDGVIYTVQKDFSLNYCHENCSIATGIKNVKSNIAYMPDESILRLKDYEQVNNAPKILRGIFIILSPLFVNFYKILTLALPIFTILTTIAFFRNHNDEKRKMFSISLILLWYSLLHIILHSLTNSNIDRYASPTIITTFIGIVIYIIAKCQKTVSKKVKNK